MAENFLNNRVILHCGDCLDVLATLPENSIDSCVTDPPYHLISIVKRFGSPTAKPVRVGDINATNDLKAAHARSAAGFMGKQWDGGDIAQSVELWSQVYRVLKPGAHLLAFGGTRTYHRMACAIEDAGFEIRDCISWNFGSGFPKSHSIGKKLDESQTRCSCDPVGDLRQVGSSSAIARASSSDGYMDWPSIDANGMCASQGPSTSEQSTNKPRAMAVQSQPQIGGAWPTCRRCGKPIVPDGYGTALKPAMELVCMARKPLSEKTVATNVLKWGTGAINVGECRVETEESLARPLGYGGIASAQIMAPRGTITGEHNLGRWPANVIHDGSEEVVGAFPESQAAYVNPDSAAAIKGKPYNAVNYIYGASNERTVGDMYTDEGSAARFFYTVKADADDRLGSRHPTVKPLDLMQYLVRLVTPRGGTVLDLFAGTGTTGEAAWREGMNAVLIEREAEYQADIRRRVELCLSGPDERQRESIKAKLKDKPLDHGPLFGGAA